MSKAIEDLKKITVSIRMIYEDEFRNIEKNLRALEIIKKYVDVENFEGLTQEQKELLKEVL